MVMRLGSNINYLAYSGVNWRWLNFFKMNGAWSTRNASSNTNEEAHLLTVCDANGYPTTLTDGGHIYTSVRAGFGVNSVSPHYPSGDWVLLYDGTGTIGVCTDGGDTVTNLVDHGSGRVTFTIAGPSSAGIYLSLTETDPSATGDYIRNIRVCEARYESLLTSGEIFRPEYIAQMAPYKCLRFLDPSNVLSDLTVDWSNRKPFGYYSWYHDDLAGKNRGEPYELIIALCNKLGVDCWIQTPCNASDDYMAQMAVLFHTTLNSNLTCYVEFFNECWLQFLLNGATFRDVGIAFIATARAQSPAITDENGAALSSDGQYGWYYSHIRAVKMADTWIAQWGADEARCIPVAACQMWTDRNLVHLNYTQASYFTGKVADHFKAFSAAPYFADSIPYAVAWSADADGGVAKCLQETVSGGVLPSAAAAVTTTTASGGVDGVDYAVTYGSGDPTNGTIIAVKFHANAGTSPTLKLNGGAVAVPINKNKDIAGSSSYFANDVVAFCYTDATSSGACTPQWIAVDCGQPGGWVGAAITAITAEKTQVADVFGLPLVCYEGGMSSLDYSPGKTVPELQDMIAATLRDSGYQVIFSAYLNGMQAAGVTLFNHFFDCGNFSPYGDWGALESAEQTSSPRYDALAAFRSRHRVTLTVSA